MIEFQRGDLMDADFLRWLDDVRHLAGVPFILTSDARTPEENMAVGGSPNSYHLKGRAVDFSLRDYKPDTLYKVMYAALTAPAPFGKEVEYVIADKHFHLAWLNGQQPSRLILKSED